MARRTNGDTLKALPCFKSCFSLAPWRANPALEDQTKRGSVTGDSHGKQFYHQTVTRLTHMPRDAQRSQLYPPPYKYSSYLRKLQARQGERQWRTQDGSWKMEHRLGSKAVGPPPLIITTLWTRSGYSWARKVQNDTLWEIKWKTCQHLEKKKDHY